MHSSGADSGVHGDPESHVSVPCFLLAVGAAGARHAPGVLRCPPDSPAAVRRVLGVRHSKPLISASSPFPPSAHIGAAHWGNSPQLQRQKTTGAKKNQPLALCACISEKWDISMPLDYPYSLYEQFLMHYSLKPGMISILTLTGFSRTLLHLSVSEKDGLR